MRHCELELELELEECRNASIFDGRNEGWNFIGVLVDRYGYRFECVSILKLMPLCLIKYK